MPKRIPLDSIRRLIAKGKQVCLFGIGEQLTDCYRQLELLLGRTPDLLCDNAAGKWGHEYFGIKCISPSELAQYHHNVIVIIAIRNYESPYRQISKMGIKDIFIACYDRCYDVVRAVKAPEDKSPELPLGGVRKISLRGKWTFVSGASRGIGKQIAMAIAGQGSNVVVHATREAHTKEVLGQCRSLGVEAVPIGADFSSMSAVEKMLDRLASLAPPVDIAYNNAAVSPPSHAAVQDIPAAEFTSAFTVNTLAPIRICQTLLPSMVKRGFGRIVTISSAIQKKPADAAYACSKAALNKFVHDLAPGLAGTGVMLTLVNPGWLRTDMGGGYAPLAVESVVPGVLLGALYAGDINGRWIGAQDYAGMTLEKAISRARFYLF